MILPANLLKKFNQQSTLVVLGSYPSKGHIHDKNKDALASFTKNRITGLNPTSKNKIIIITHQDNKPEIEASKNLLILRVFKKNNPLSFLITRNIFSELSEVKHLLIEYEFSTFGDNQMTISFIPFLKSLKKIDININIEIHQVLLNLQQLKGHLGYQNHDIRTKIFNNALIYFYKSIGKYADKIIVLEEHLKNKLSRIVDNKKIYCLPHGVEKFKKYQPQNESKKSLGIEQKNFVVLMFGYLTWYKGSDIFVKTAQDLSKNKRVTFILAGGQSHNQKHKPHYQKWYQQLQKQIKLTPNLIHTTFVPEKQISTYYSAADLVVFPYRTFMSSSGPLSICFSHKKPFLLSKKLSPYLKSPDINKSLQDQNFDKKLIFEPNSNELGKRISFFKKNKSHLNHLKSISSRIAKNRYYAKLGVKQRHIIFSK